MNKNKLFTKNNILLILSFLGICVSSYLWYYQVNPDATIPCTTDGCTDVLTSPSGKLFGIPMSVFGFFYYAFLVVILFERNFITHKIIETLIMLTLFAGLIFSLYLRYLEFFVIHSICSWCWVSFMIVLSLMATYFINPKKSGSITRKK